MYALGVGAGGEDPEEVELEFTTENTIGLEHRVLPTFPISLPPETKFPWFDVEPGTLLHAEQSIAVYADLPPAGAASIRSGIGGMYDKGTGALIELWHHFSDPAGFVFAETETRVFLRGHGGFGGERKPSPGWFAPKRQPDAVVTQATMPWQALLYRLSGERMRARGAHTGAARPVSAFSGGTPSSRGTRVAAGQGRAGR
jgi:hypothetical protein